MNQDLNKTEISSLPDDVLRLIFRFLSWSSLSQSAPVSKKWARLVNDQKSWFYRKLRGDKGINLAFIPRELYQAYPIDPQVLYRKLQSVPSNKIWTSGTMVRLYTAYMLFYAMYDAQAFFTAKERFLAEHPKDGFGRDNYLGSHIAQIAAISGSVEVIQSFGDEILDYSLCNRPSDLMEGAIQGNSWELVSWLIEQREHFREGIDQWALWAIEYDRPYILQQLESQYELSALKNEKRAQCLGKAIASGSPEMVERFLDQNNVPDHLLHSIASYGHTHLMRWALDHLSVDINAKNDKGQMPIHVAAASGCCELVTFIAQSDVCALPLKNPDHRSTDMQSDVDQLIWASFKHPSILKLLHERYGLSLAVINEEQQTLLFKAIYYPEALRYLVLFSDIDLAHVDAKGCKFYQNNNQRSASELFYFSNLDTLEFLAKAISGDADQNAFEAKLLQLSVIRKQDPVVCLALALLYHDDAALNEHYLRQAFDLHPGRAAALVEQMGAVFAKYFPDHAVNLEAIKPALRDRCVIC